MKDLHPRIPLSRLCGLVDKSRQAFYQRQKVIYAQAMEEEFVLSEVKKIRHRQPRLGGRKLLVKLEESGIQIGRDALFALLGQNGLLVRRRRNATRTTNSHHWLRKYPNLIRHFEPMRPNQLWVCDITYLETTEGYLYLFLITDACSHKIIGWALADNLESDNAVKALQMAFKTMKTNCFGLIHHSDRGVQYCSDKYVKLLNQYSIQISMTENGDPLENAIAERVNGILKNEWLYDIGRIDMANMHKIIPQIIHIYNHERPHLSLDMLTPNVAHQMTEQLKKRWKNYYKPDSTRNVHEASSCTN